MKRLIIILFSIALLAIAGFFLTPVALLIGFSVWGFVSDLFSGPTAIYACHAGQENSCVTTTEATIEKDPMDGEFVSSFNLDGKVVHFPSSSEPGYCQLGEVTTTCTDTSGQRWLIQRQL